MNRCLCSLVNDWWAVTYFLRACYCEWCVTRENHCEFTLTLLSCKSHTESGESASVRSVECVLSTLFLQHRPTRTDCHPQLTWQLTNIEPCWEYDFVGDLMFSGEGAYAFFAHVNVIAPVVATASVILAAIKSRIVAFWYWITRLCWKTVIKRVALLLYLSRSVHVFFQVMQMFYPYSMQLYPNVFPGEDPRDCPRNVNKDQWVLLRVSITENNNCMVCIRAIKAGFMNAL